ncbi:UDP-glycosyltransferase 73C5 [Apostasia shenzhenica]|uniref:Glycosyltransferase n=1 Tax=Apostasia shenzhenica TaxID=1088818 RepID=A0A2I0A0W8_9ASPA|nr:UDP-glycosyltransferase 73C5 [Apostasia shenzhenica]
MPVLTPAAAGELPRDHFVLFPFMSKGHTLPLLHFATALSSLGALVTIITTPANVPFIRRHIFSSARAVRLIVLPFPSHPDLPAGVESTDSLPSISLFPSFLAATTLLQAPFLRHFRLLLRSPNRPLCLVSDFFLSWTFPICRRFRLPRLAFHGMSAFSMSLSKALWLNLPAVSGDDEPFSVPGTPPDFRLTMAEVPVSIRKSVDPLDPESQFLNEAGPSDVQSWGILVNSFAELEHPMFVELLESFYRSAGGGRAWLVGPLSLLGGSDALDTAESAPESDSLRWLDRQLPGSVVYVSFGTQADVSSGQLDELAHGLVRAGFPFIWAVRAQTWDPPEEAMSKLSQVGRIERGWVPQAQLLRHVAIGGFVSHCGWNSVLEAATSGVPLLAWPMMAEQYVNAKMVVDDLQIGVRLATPPPVAAAAEAAVLGRRAVEEGLRELMGGEKGRRARERAAEVAAMAAAAVAEGGSSNRTLGKLLEALREAQDPAEVVVVEGSEAEAVEMEAKMVEWEWQDGIQMAM